MEGTHDRLPGPLHDRLHLGATGCQEHCETAADVHSCLGDFLAEHHTLVLATVEDGQPWCTRVFFAEEIAAEEIAAGRAADWVVPTLFLLAKTPSRKLANLEHDARVGIFVGPEQPTAWLEARGRAALLRDPTDDAAARARVLAKSPEAGPFLARVTAVAVQVQVEWLRLTDVRATPRRVIEIEAPAPA